MAPEYRVVSVLGLRVVGEALLDALHVLQSVPAAVLQTEFDRSRSSDRNPKFHKLISSTNNINNTYDSKSEGLYTTPGLDKHTLSLWIRSSLTDGIRDLPLFKQSLLPIHQEKHYIISEMEVSAQALSIIDKVTKLQVDVRINSQQCKRLVDCFEYVGQLITKWDSLQSGGGGEQPLQAWDGGEVQVSRNFDQLLVVLKKGEALVMECSGQDLRTKVFLNTDNRHAFEEIHRDLDTCASFVHMDDLSSLGKGSGFCTMTEEERANCLTTDAGQDLGEVLQLGSETMNGSWEGPQEGAEKLMKAVKHKIEHGRYDQESNGLPDGVFMDASDMKITRALGKGADIIISEVDWLRCKLAAKYYFFVQREVNS
ncbi:unnamed protein product [Sphagnum troendelagicum]|uniref:Uncharacterized protein n=1 Tax=Sphagnum troendelagicum TaxID=128251 RepID=A0ABP0T9G2_9BRYO